MNVWLIFLFPPMEIADFAATDGINIINYMVTPPRPPANFFQFTTKNFPPLFVPLISFPVGPFLLRALPSFFCCLFLLPSN
jgi:hypothetical protein